MIKVSVDMKRGVYVIRGDGENQTIQMPIKGHYDKGTVKNLRDEIERPRKWIPSEKLNLVDVGVYNALREYDRKYETDYANKYVDVTIKQIPYSSTAEKKRNYEKRVTDIKSQEFKNNGIDLEYNLSLFSGLKNMSIGDRIQAIKVAFMQKRNGIRVQFRNDKQLLLEAPEEDLKVEERDSAIVQNVMTTAKKMDGITEKDDSQKTIVSNSPSFEEIMGINSRLSQIPKEKAEIPEIPEIPVRPGIKDTPEITQTPAITPIPEIPVQTIVPIIQPTIVEERTPEVNNIGKAETDNSNKKSGENTNTIRTPKKKISRSKSIQAAKKAQRESQKMKNIYKAKIQAKAEKREQVEKRAKEGAQPKKVKQTPPVAPISPVQVPPVPPVRKPEKAKQEGLVPVRTIVPSKMSIQQQGKVQIAKFTGKIKEKADALRNKKLTPRQRNIAGAVTLVAAITLAVSIGAYTTRSVTDILQKDNTYEPSTPQIEQVVEINQGTVSQGGISRADYINKRIQAKGEEKTGEHTQIETSATIKNQEAIKEQEETKNENIKQEEQDSRTRYLSSIKVGASLNINSGKFFETPEGQGKYGKFDSYTDGVKEINLIDVMTKDGYIIVKDSNTSLYDLKQQYPDAKFSYHIVCKNADGSTKTLGWLTEDSLEQNQQRVDQQFEMEDMER